MSNTVKITAGSIKNDPLVALKHIAEWMANELIEKMNTALPSSTPLPAVEVLPVDPSKIYTAKEVAEIFGIDRVATIYDIPQDELPRVRLNSRRYGYWGINILCYMSGQTPVDIEAIIKGHKDRLKKEHPNIMPIGTKKEGLKRVM